MANRLLLGATYYPEHWPADQHARDLDRMAAAGLNVVRLGEGAWWYWEPREGSYQFELFDRVIDLCRQRDIKVIMGTPTYTGPAWIAANYPEVLRVNFDRVLMAHGSRQNYCHNSPKFRDLSRRVTAALAEHYKGDAQIVGWQLDNEINNVVDASYGPCDAVAWRAWLRDRYGSLDALNHAWGTRFWSQVYDDWEQIDLPAPTSQWPNPHRLLDHSRFVSDSAIDFLREQADILRAANPRWAITHNGLFGNVNGPDLAKIVDFYSHDHYPLFWKHWSEFGQKLIEARSLTFPFAIMEQQAGPGGQMAYLQRTPAPGEMRLWTYQSIAHGADKLLYFTWRTCPVGSEQHWHGLIEADGKDTRRLREAADTAKELARLPEAYFEARPLKSIGVLRDFDVDVNEKRINTYTDDARWGYGRWAAAYLRQHIPIDFVWSGGDFRGYDNLIAGSLKLVDEALVARLTRYVEDGGTLVLTAQSGLHDRNLHVTQKTPPGLLAELAGVEVEEFTVVPKGERCTMRFSDELDGYAIGVAERLRPTTASPVAHWGPHRLLGGAPAATLHYVGKGRVVYIGGYLDDSMTRVLVDHRINTGHLKRIVKASDSVECVARECRKNRFVTLLNHGDTPADIRGLPFDAHTLIGPAMHMGTLRLDAFDVAVVSMPR